MKTEKFTSAQLNEQYTLTTLDNGLKVYVFEKENFNTAYALFGTQYGSIDTEFSLNGGETVKVPEGIAHFLEHKLFESEDGDAFTKYAKTGAYANAYTSFDRTCYLFNCSNMFEENLDILLDFVQNPYFTQQTVDKEQGIIGQEIRMYDDSPVWCVFFNLLDALYFNHPVKIDIAGTVESIAKIDAPLLYKCYNTFYNPANMFICIAGNVDGEKVIQKINGSIKKHDKADIKRVTPPEPQDVRLRYIEKKLDVAMPLFNYGYKLPADKAPTQRDSICTDVLLNCLFGDITPFYEEMTEKCLINDEFDTEFFFGRGYSAVILSGESADPKKVCEAAKKRIADVMRDGVDEKIFEAVRRDLYGGAVKRYNSVEDIAASLTDSAISGYNVFDEIEILKSINKTDVEKYLKIFDENKSALSVILPR